MRVTKKSNTWDVKELPWKGPATLTKYEDRVIKAKGGNRDLNLYDLYFEVDDVPGNEVFEGLEIKKGLWYEKDEDGGTQMSTPNFQVLEALEGLDVDDAKEDGEKSDHLDDLVGNRALLTVNESKKNPGFPEITRVEPYDDDEDDEDEKPKKKKKGKKGKKSTSKSSKKKSKPEPVNDDEDDDDDDEDDEPVAKPKKSSKKGKSEKVKSKKSKSDDDDDEDDDDYNFDDDEDDDDDDDD